MATHRATAVPSTIGAPAEIYELGRETETGTQRIRRLQNEARLLAREQVEILASDFEALAVRATEIAEGGDAYPAGVRELASRIAADLQLKANGLMSIIGRTAQD